MKRPEDFEDRDWSYGGQPPTPDMTNAEFLAFVADLTRDFPANSVWQKIVREARLKFAHLDVNDMVAYAYLVAGYVLSDSYGIPFPEEIDKMLAVPSSYLHRVAYNRCSHEWHHTLYALTFYKAGLPADFVTASHNSMSHIHGSGEWGSAELIRIYESGVSAEYVEATNGIMCSPENLALMYHAGVPAEYVVALADMAMRRPRDSFKGMKPKDIIAAWGLGLPLEYAMASVGAG